jgi:uncharacterized protein
MKAFVSPIFSRGSFLAGIGFGIPAGFLEEIGWTGYAFPKMCEKMSPLTAGMLLGLLWGSWHLPVIDFLGTAAPHGRYLVPYFFAFIVAMTAMRVLIGHPSTGSRLAYESFTLRFLNNGSRVLVIAQRHKLGIVDETR